MDHAEEIEPIRRNDFRDTLNYECQIMCVLRELADLEPTVVAESIGCGVKNINKLERSDVEDGHVPKGIYLDLLEIDSTYVADLTGFGLRFYSKNLRALFGWKERCWHPAKPCKELQNYALRLTVLAGIAFVCKLDLEAITEYLLEPKARLTEKRIEQLSERFNQSVEKYHKMLYFLDEAAIGNVWDLAVYYKNQIHKKNEKAYKKYREAKK